jgi:hypothetical protein
MGGDRRGGCATRAGEPKAEQPGDAPEAGGSADLSSATATGEGPQSPQDHQDSAAPLAFAFAFARLLADLVCSSPGCSIKHEGPKIHVPFWKSGQTPEAGAPGLEFREAFVTFQAACVFSSSAVRAR